MDKIKIGITHGDPNAVGYEVILKAFEDPTMLDLCIPIVYGSTKMATYHRKKMDLSTTFHAIKDASDAIPEKLNLVDCIKQDMEITLGKLTPESVAAGKKSLDIAIEDYKQGKIDALVVNPLSSTEIKNQLAYLQQALAPEQNPLTVLVTEDLRIALATTDTPADQIESKLNEELILQRLHQTDQCLKRDFLLTRSRIALLALHDEPADTETQILKPAVEAVAEDRINAYGPYNAETFFNEQLYRPHDAVIATSESQAKPYFKSITQGEGVIYMANLPVVCAMPAMELQLQIAGQGKAEPQALNHAIYMAVDVCRNRKAYDKAHKRPLPKLFHDKHDDNRRGNIE